MTARISARRGPPTTDFILHADRIGQDIAGNYTLVRLYVQAISQGANWGWSNYRLTHYGGIDGVGWAGSHTVDRLTTGFGPGAQRWNVHIGDLKVPHGSDGTRGAVTLRMKVETADRDLSGEWTASFNDFPSIPRGPRVRHNGAWRNTVAYVKHNGTWKIAIPHAKASGAWKVSGG